MADITNIVTGRDGSIAFTMTGTSNDGRVRIMNPRFPPVTVSHNGTKIPPGSGEISAVKQILEDWFSDQMTPQVEADLTELDRMRPWRDLPERLNNAVLLHRVRWLIQTMKSQASE